MCNMGEGWPATAAPCRHGCPWHNITSRSSKPTRKGQGSVSSVACMWTCSGWLVLHLCRVMMRGWREAMGAVAALIQQKAGPHVVVRRSWWGLLICRRPGRRPAVYVAWVPREMDVSGPPAGVVWPLVLASAFSGSSPGCVAVCEDGRPPPAGALHAGGIPRARPGGGGGNRSVDDRLA